MRKAITQLSLLVLPCLLGVASSGHGTPSASKVSLDSTTKLDLINAAIKWVEYRGGRALHVVPLAGCEHTVNEEMAAVLTESDFKDGTIELDVAGARRAVTRPPRTPVGLRE
jgi:hypothetical protein